MLYEVITGDSSYQFFCQTGKDFDAYLEQAGASRLLDRVDLDVDYRAGAAAWSEQVLAKVQETLSLGAPAAGVTAVAQAVGHSRYDKFNPYTATLITRITSYNVCYTKLLRLAGRRWQ